MNMKNWQVQEAKAKFSEVVRNATSDGPQHITMHGKPVVVVVSEKDYAKLTKSKMSFVEFLRQSPLAGLDMEIERDQSLCRETNI